MSNKRYRNFTFTHNNYTDTSLEDEISCKYIVYGREVGESGTPHLQGFLSFSCGRTLSAAIKSLPGCHVEGPVMSMLPSNTVRKTETLLKGVLPL